MTKKTALIAVLGLFVCAAAFAQDPKAPVDSKLQEIMGRLETQRISVDFSGGETLEGAIQSIKDQIRYDIHVSPTVRDAHATPDITLRLQNVSVKSILKIMLGDKGLTMVYRKGVLVVVDRKEVEARTVTRVYDVRDLLYTIKPFPGPKVELVPPDSAGGTALSGAIFDIEDEGEGAITQDFLTQIVKDMTPEGKWDENADKVNISLVNNLLVVTQTDRVQEDVGKLLNLIRQFK